ncbi:cell cycle regulator of non-homologous end joining isoform X2 [Pseudophryne corroboree]
MDGGEPIAKKRVLPPWMTEDKAKTKKLCTKHLKREKISPRKRTVYCMDEKELVEYALEILNEVKTRSDIKKDAVEDTQEDEDKPAADKVSDEESPLPLEGSSRTLKSILPLSKDLRDSAAGPGTHSDEDDDPLKYVREIFFS